VKKIVPDPPAEMAAAVDLGSIVGQNLSFALLAGRCSAAQAAALKTLRDSKLYRRLTPEWREFCDRYLKMSRAHADQLIRLLDEFGPGYFELAQLTRISPATYRAVAPSIRDGALRHQGNSIELSVENSRELAAAVADMRRAQPAKTPAPPVEMHVRLRALDRRCTRLLNEFAEIARQERCGENFLAFTSVVSRMASALRRLELECGVA